MNIPLVSICCITYNHASYIRQCLDGFIMQECDFYFEVLIHDDASTDGTSDIIRKYQEKYPDIIKPIIQNENQWVKGLKGNNRRHNFPRAQGKYIAMCEGDDYWTDPNKLQKQFNFMEANPEYSLCTHDFVIHYEHKDIPDIIASNKFLYLKSKPIPGYPYFGYDLKDFAIHLDGLHTATNFIKKDILMAELSKISAQVTSGDYLVKLLLLHKGKGCFIPDIMSVLRKNPGGVTQQKNDILKMFEIQRNQLNYFAHLSPKPVKKYFYRRLWKIYPSYILGRNDYKDRLTLSERLSVIPEFFRSLIKSI